MVTNGLEQKDLDKFNDSSRLEDKESFKDNRYWLSLKRQYMYGINLEEVFEFEAKLMY